MNILKSANDKNIYKYLHLGNRLRCLLVSDEEADKSSAALSVEVGSLWDPREFEGLAHFWEHMLFMGTEKYPGENHYHKFISEHGGSNNAFTSPTSTWYFFDIANEDLKDATDVFSEFFKTPLFNESSTEREINAVDSEFRQNYSSDSRKLHQLFKCRASNPLSPYNKFQSGNLETLNKDGVRDELLKFHKKYYSSNIMNLCIYGKASIEELEQLAIEYFENIENKDVLLEDPSTPHPYPTENLKKIYKFVPNNDMRQLDIRFILPCTKQMYKSKPGGCISSVLGHEGEGSVLSYLIAEGLVTEMTTLNDNIMDACDYFGVSISLTEKGERNYEKVLKIIFAAINKLKETKLNKYLFDEQVAMNKLNFENQAKQSALNTSLKLASRMQELVERDIDMEQLLYYPYILEEFDEQAISDYMQGMTPENALIFFCSKSHESIADKTDDHYNTKFSVSDIDKTLVSELSNITFEKLESEGVKSHNKVFHLPYENTFIPYNTQSIKSSEQTDFKVIEVEGAKDCKAWYKQDDKFNQPKLNIKLMIRTNDLDHKSSAKAKVFKKLWSDMVEEKLREPGYMANLAQISYDISSNAQGVTLSFGGYNDGIQNFVEFILKETLEIEDNKTIENEELFKNRKDLLKQAYKSVLKTNAYRRYGEFIHLLINPQASSTDIMLETLNNFTFEDYLEMKKDWLKNIATEWLVSGHINQADTKKMISKWESYLESFKADVSTEKEFVILNPSTVNEYSVQHLNDEELNSTAIWYWQSDKITEDLTNYGLNTILFEVLEQSAFDFLRTKEQLGYVVFTFDNNISTVLGGSILVHSPVKHSDYLVQRINAFIDSQKSRILDLSDEEFNSYKNSVIAKMQVKDVSLARVTNRAWSEIYDQLYMFDRQQGEIDALKAITKEQLIKYYKELFLDECRRINIKVKCKKHEELYDSSQEEANQKWYSEHGLEQIVINEKDLQGFRNIHRLLQR